ncbi:MAG: hypothetical protein M0Z60_14875 [Nitrospiraceae bacterium]|nr:hypothetical protein [Nitrospiraceae bacterium]
MRKQLLFVTYESEDMDEGLNYAIDLAKTMDKDISILIANNKKSLRERFDDLMTAVAFAEANEHDSARQAMARGESVGESAEKKAGLLAEKCRESGVGVNVHEAAVDLFPAIKDFLGKKSGIDMVILSPSITDNGNVSARELNKLVRTASRPVVTMARQTFVPAHSH